MRTRSGRALWSVPYPQELNDIPMSVARQMDAKDFALHPYIVGQPYRLRHLRRALEHVAAARAARDAGSVWMATPGANWHHAMAQPAF